MKACVGGHDGVVGNRAQEQSGILFLLRFL